MRGSGKNFVYDLIISYQPLKGILSHRHVELQSPNLLSFPEEFINLSVTHTKVGEKFD